MTVPTDEVVLIIEGGADSETIPLQGRSITMGRQSSNDVVVAEPGVSRKHAELADSQGMFVIRDLKSTNGTFVNSKKIDEGDYHLQDGDSIRLGASKVTYTFHNPMASTLAITLEQPAIGDAEQPIGERESPATMITELPALGETENQEQETYEGAVRLSVRADGNVGLVVSFVQKLQQNSEFRLHRMANNRDGSTDVWLALRQPIPLRGILGEMAGVSEIKPSKGDGPAPGSDENPLSVLLGGGDDPSGDTAQLVPCVSCKEPLPPGTPVCPSCGKTQA